jgi:hypothetical protein
MHRTPASQSMPLLTDLMPWQQPGVMMNRTWPIAPEPSTLVRRWQALLARTDAMERAEAFVTARTGRNIHTSVAGLTRLSELRADAPHRAIVPYGYRSFDLQWTFEDPRVANLERPALWRTLSDRQVFLTSLTSSALGPGPALTVTAAVPDKHHFRGSYGGKDVIPLYRDREGDRNVTRGLLSALSERLGIPISAEDFVEYLYATLAHPHYQATFSAELATPGPRVPITTEPELFAEAVALGQRLLYLHTFGTRFSSERLPANALPRVPGLEWCAAVTAMPESMEDIAYDAAAQELRVIDGRLSGVRQEVWNFTVSGWPVVQRWVGARTRRGIGRAVTRPRPLDLIRPDEWVGDWNYELLRLLNVITHTLDTWPAEASLLDRILEGDLMPATSLPSPASTERDVPAL